MSAVPARATDRTRPDGNERVRTRPPVGEHDDLRGSLDRCHGRGQLDIDRLGGDLEVGLRPAGGESGRRQSRHRRRGGRRYVDGRSCFVGRDGRCLLVCVAGAHERSDHDGNCDECDSTDQQLRTQVALLGSCVDRRRGHRFVEWQALACRRHRRVRFRGSRCPHEVERAVAHRDVVGAPDRVSVLGDGSFDLVWVLVAIGHSVYRITSRRRRRRVAGAGRLGSRRSESCRPPRQRSRSRAS